MASFVGSVFTDLNPPCREEKKGTFWVPCDALRFGFVISDSEVFFCHGLNTMQEVGDLICDACSTE